MYICLLIYVQGYINIYNPKFVLYQNGCVSIYVFIYYLIFWMLLKHPLKFRHLVDDLWCDNHVFIKGLQNIGCMNYSWAKIFLSLMSITMLELCSYGQKRQLYSINIERCPRENDTPFHRNLWLTCYHDLRTGVLFQAVWLIHILKNI